MARPGHVPITRLRFYGRGATLRAMCQVFREHPGVGLSASEIAEHGKLGFRDVHQRLLDTPELFVRLPKRPDANVRYRLASALASESPEAVDRFIAEATRAETRIAAIVAAAFVAVFLTALTLSLSN
jgi:hypothetical protein